jgi:transcriptional regulator with XRE-family HTH domain
MTEAETLGERLRKAMRAKRVKREAIAEAAGVHINTVSQWIGDRFPPTVDKISAIASLLGVTPAWLQYGENGGPGHVGEEIRTFYQTRHVPEVAFTSAPAAQRARHWLEGFLLEIAEQGADQEFVDSSRRLLLNPSNYEHGFGAAAGARDAMDDEQKLRHMQALAVGVREALKYRLKQLQGQRGGK